jgi:hypothetical protein
MPCKHVFDDGKKCTKSALYNLAGLKPEFCKAHKTDDMVDVFSVRCDYVSETGDCCKKTVSWGYPNNKKKIRCAEHKLDGMKDLKHPSCEEPDCPNSRSYGFPNDKAPTHCSEHKKEGMINVKHKKCESCGQIPSYNYDGELTARFCNDHQLDGMVDVTHRRCEFERCKFRPLYNVVTETRPRFCVHHKSHEMVDVANKKCEFGGCNRWPAYNFPKETKARFCSIHKTNGMISVIGKKCINEWCDNRFQTNRNDNYCIYCFVHMFPDKPNSRNYKTKEKAVCDFILEMFPNMTWISDKRVQDGCSRRRPDLLLDLGYQVIIIEIDENQHIDYDCSCENKRLMELSQDVGHRNIIFIRFNPDDYQDRNDNKVKSCWSMNKTTGMSVVTKKDINDWVLRLKCLQSQVQYWLDNKSGKMVEIIQLFYDEY